jgi:hypothetical protein
MHQPEVGQPSLEWPPAVAESQLDGAPNDPRTDPGPTNRATVSISDERLESLTWGGLVLNHDRHEAIIRSHDPAVGHAIDLDRP